MNNRPIAILLLVVAVFVLTLVIDRLRRRRRSAHLYALARDARMNYSPVDRFDLAARLRSSPDWLTDATDLNVRDVLYATRDGLRHFVATATRRHTADERPRIFVIQCTESLADHERRETRPRREVDGQTLFDAYRQAAHSESTDPVQ